MVEQTLMNPISGLITFYKQVIPVILIAFIGIQRRYMVRASLVENVSYLLLCVVVGLPRLQVRPHLIRPLLHRIHRGLVRPRLQVVLLQVRRLPRPVFARLTEL